MAEQDTSQNDALEAMQADQAYQASQPRPQAAPTQALPTDAAPPVMAGKPWQPAPDAQPIDVSSQFEKPQAPAGKGSVVKDMAKEAWAAAQDTGAGLLGAASWTARQVGASPDSIAYIEHMRQAVSDHAASTIASMSPEEQLAHHASIFGGTDENGQHVPTPGEVGYLRYAGSTLASMVPDGLMMMLPGPDVAAAGKLGMSIAGKVGQGVARALEYGARMGTVNLGDTYEQFAKDVTAVPDDKYQASSPVYAQMRSSGMSEQDAKAAVVKQGMTQLGALNFALGTLTAAGQGSMLRAGALTGQAKSMLARIGIGATEGSALMGAQAAGQNALQQQAGQDAGTQQGFDTSSLARAAASGALGGAVMGAASGVLHGAHEEPAPKAAPETTETAEAGPNTSDIDAATQLALQNHLGPAQGALDLNQAPPGLVPGQPQGELFRSADQANTTVAPAAAPAAEQQPPVTQPGSAAPPAQAAAGPKPSDGMKVGELRDALKTMPGQDPTVLARMSKTDLAAAYDKAQTPAEIKSDPNAAVTTVVPGTIRPQIAPEPAGDVQAQVNAVADPNNPKDAAFIAQGTPAPEQMPQGVQTASRPEGTLVTTDPDKAAAFANGPHTDEKMADLLNYQEPKSAETTVAVQGKDAQGNVVHEEAVSPKNVEAAKETAKAAAPGGTVEVTTPEAAIARRAAPQSKRALAKQQMAEAGPAKKGEVVTVGGKKSTPVVEREVRTHDEAMQDLRDAVTKAVTPIKGPQVDAVMRKVMSELSARMTDTKTEGDIHEAVAKWAQDKPGERVAGSNVRRGDIGDQLTKMLTGKSAAEFSGHADDVGADARAVRSADAARQGGVSAGMRDEAKTEATREGGNIEKAEAPSEGVANYEGAGASKALPEDHGDKLPAVLVLVIQVTLTVHVAQREIGMQKPGPGRPRTPRHVRRVPRAHDQPGRGSQGGREPHSEDAGSRQDRFPNAAGQEGSGRSAARRAGCH